MEPHRSLRVGYWTCFLCVGLHHLNGVYVLLSSAGSQSRNPRCGSHVSCAHRTQDLLEATQGHCRYPAEDKRGDAATTYSCSSSSNTESRLERMPRPVGLTVPAVPRHVQGHGLGRLPEAL